MKRFLNILLVTVAIFSCYVEDIYLFLNPIRSGQPISMTLRAHHGFEFDQEKELNEKRDRALEAYVPLFTYRSESVETSKAKMVDLIMKVHSLQTYKKMTTKDFLAYIRKEFQIQIKIDTLHKVLQHTDLIKVLSGVLTIQETILNQKILNDMKWVKGKKIVEILYPDPAGRVAYAANDIISIQGARQLLKERTRKLFWKVPTPVLDFVLRVSSASILPNLSYDRKENSRRIEKIIKKFPSTTIAFAPMEVLASFGSTAETKEVLLVKAYQDVRSLNFLPSLSFITLSTLMMTLYLNLFFKKVLVKKSSHFEFVLSVIIVSILLLRLILLFTTLSVYILPFSLVPLLFILLNYDRISIMGVTLVTAAMVTMFTGQTFEIFLFFTLGGVAAILFSPKITKRFHVIYPSLLIGGVNALYVALTHLNMDDFTLLSDGSRMTYESILLSVWHHTPLLSMGEAFIGGLMVGPVALILLPIFEVKIHLASTFKLNRLADLNHPLLKELASKTPGTYQHTMMVAHLAHAAGEAVGADTLLLRVGAYYHDLGKALNSNLFTENQFSGKNRHDKMDPRESAAVIINHVIKGKRIAEGHGLPDNIIDLICQHHGTQKVEYFYNKALKSLPKEEVKASDFRYLGPKPQTIEAAILMIADSLEAAARSLEKPTRENLRALVIRTVQSKMVDGQFDECELTTAQIATISKSFTRTLEASLHSRVKYPWQEKKNKTHRIKR